MQKEGVGIEGGGVKHCDINLLENSGNRRFVPENLDAVHQILSESYGPKTSLQTFLTENLDAVH